VSFFAVDILIISREGYVFLTVGPHLLLGIKTTKIGVRESVEGSLAELGFIPDLFLVHSPFIDDVAKIGELWGYLEELVLDGTLRGCSLGLSNFRPQDIETIMSICRIKPVCNRECIA
jgi:diketogulonate reductase-like aldo/keto reductase